METASDIIKDALGELVVQGAEAAIEAVDAQVAIRFMNRFMDQLFIEGAALGYTAVSNLSDPITITPGAIDGLVANLAKNLAPTFGIQITQDLAVRARDGRKAMFIAGFRIGPSQYPGTLPIGSGNEGDSHRTGHFYPEAQDDILTEAGGAIGLESGTAEDVSDG